MILMIIQLRSNSVLSLRCFKYQNNPNPPANITIIPKIPKVIHNHVKLEYKINKYEDFSILYSL